MTVFTTFYLLGVSALGSVFRPTIDAEGMSVVEAAVKAGINWFDAAPWYGHGKGETVFGRVVCFHVFLFAALQSGSDDHGIT